MRELERKYLVLKLPALEGCVSHAIEQGYLATELGRSEVRMRRIDGDLLLTAKRDRQDGEGMRSRDELNVSLQPDQWEALWTMTVGRRVSKRRYEVPYGDRMIEIDVFTGPTEGIITAEVEFPDVDASRAFVPPEWLGEDITQDPTYSNWHLAQ
jgi:adenylate cyclase